MDRVAIREARLRPFLALMRYVVCIEENPNMRENKYSSFELQLRTSPYGFEVQK